VVSYDREIPPGGKGKITLKVSTKNRKGKVLKRALVITNDRSKKPPIISISGKIKAVIYVEPRPYVFLNGLVGDKIDKEIRLVAGDIPRFSIKKADTTLKEKISYSLSTVKKGKEYILKIENKYPKKGNYYGSIKLYTDNPTKPLITIRVSGRITGELVAVPRTLFFGRVSPENIKSGSKNLSRQLFVKNLKKKPFHILDLDYDKKSFKVEMEPSQNDGTIKLHVSPELDHFKKGNYFSFLKIKTDVPSSQELSIGLRIFIQ